MNIDWSNFKNYGEVDDDTTYCWCGGKMVGEECVVPYHCETIEVPEGAEADSGPYYCHDTDEAQEITKEDIFAGE